LTSQCPRGYLGQFKYESVAFLTHPFGNNVVIDADGWENPKE
jgi:hypothetical protein